MFEQKEKWERGKRLAKRKQLILFNLIQLINYGESTERDETQQLYHISKPNEDDNSAQTSSSLLGCRPLFWSESCRVQYFCTTLILSSTHTKFNTTLSTLSSNWKFESEIGVKRKVKSAGRKAKWKRKRQKECEIEVQIDTQWTTIAAAQHDLANIFEIVTNVPTVVVSAHWPQLYLGLNSFCNLSENQ